MRPIFQNSTIREVDITNEILYYEFSNVAEFKSVFKNLKDSNKIILYAGIHRIEAGLWIIVLKKD